jgi:hypothetical protein
MPRAQPRRRLVEQRAGDLHVVDRVEEAEVPRRVVPLVEPRAVDRRGDATDQLAVAPRGEQRHVRVAVERVLGGVELLLDDHVQRRDPGRVVAEHFEARADEIAHVLTGLVAADLDGHGAGRVLQSRAGGKRGRPSRRARGGGATGARGRPRRAHTGD